MQPSCSQTAWLVFYKQTSNEKSEQKKAVMDNLRACLLICSLKHRVLMGVTREKCWCAIWTVPTEWVTWLSCYPAHLLALHLQNHATQFYIQDRLNFLYFLEILTPDKKIVCICNVTTGWLLIQPTTRNCVAVVLSLLYKYFKGLGDAPALFNYCLLNRWLNVDRNF